MTYQGRLFYRAYCLAKAMLGWRPELSVIAAEIVLGAATLTWLWMLNCPLGGTGTDSPKRPAAGFLVH